MEKMEIYDLPSWVLESEEDFPLGAKATPFLPSATPDPLSQDVGFDLPEWMESREILGLDSAELFNEAEFLQALKSEQLELGGHGPEELTSTIKPEDMLVPLSELQAYTSFPHGLSANPTPSAQLPLANNISGSMDLPLFQLQPQTSAPQIISADLVSKLLAPNPKVISAPVTKFPASIPQVISAPGTKFTAPIPQVISIEPVTIVPGPVPKIIISKKLVKKNPQKIITRKYHTVPDIQLVSGTNDQYVVQNQEIPTLPTKSSTGMCDADSLINEMVQMIGTSDSSGNGHIADMENSTFSSSMVEANMDDLLFQLESENSQLKEPNASWNVEPASPVSLPSPVPSAGSVSPRSPQDSLFATLISPSERSCEADESSQSGIEDLDDSLDVHSYSKSPLKKKATRKSSSRKSPYPDDRKERKKEQNKQAALRYRQKKKQEDDVILAKIHVEEERQRELTKKHTNLKQELSCFKKIMRDLFIAKGILSEDSFKKK